MCCGFFFGNYAGIYGLRFRFWGEGAGDGVPMPYATEQHIIVFLNEVNYGVWLNVEAIWSLADKSKISNNFSADCANL